jgi:hypothetical protein
MRGKMRIFIITFFISSLSYFAQAPDTIWTRTIGEFDGNQGTAVLQTQSGNFFVGGIDMSSSSIFCLNEYGNEIWSKNWRNDTTFGGSILPEIYELSNDNFVFGSGAGIGWYDHLIDSTNTIIYAWGEWGIGVAPITFKKIQNDGYMLTWNRYNAMAAWGLQLKVNLSGDTVWYKNYGEGGWEDLIWFYDVEPTNDGGSIIFGGSINAELLLQKNDEMGDSIWTKTYHDTTKNIYGKHILQTQDNGFIFLVNFYNSTTQGPTLYKTDEYGNTLWYNNLGYSRLVDFGMMKSTPDGGLILVGTTDLSWGDSSDILIVKVDEMGNKLWTKTMGGNNADYASDVCVTSDGGYIIVGTTYSFGAHHNIWVIRLEPDLVSAVDKSKEIIFEDYYLSQNYPNPFNATTTIKYSIPSFAHPLIPSKEGKERSDRGVLLTLKIYDVLGKEVATLVNEKQKPGSYEVEWDASEFSSGVYLYKLRNGDYSISKKMILLK